MQTSAHEIVRNYAPDPQVATVHAEPADGAAWWIDLSANATVVELAVLMKGLGCRCRADHTGDGAFRVSPVEPAPRPSTELIHDILTAGFGNRLPALLSKQAE